MTFDTDMFKLNLQGIPSFDEIFTFFYDETGNCRKFLLTKDGVNSPDALNRNFILGGIAFSGTEKQVNFDTLFSSLGFDKEQQKELKFKHLFHNSKSFLNFMDSNRATAFLKWLDSSDLYIHYCTLNNLYYSLADIVDSLNSGNIMSLNFILKNELYNFTVLHCNEIINILYKHNYPDIKNVQLFTNEFCSFIDNHNIEDNFYLKLLQEELRLSSQNGELTFIQDNTPYTLIDEYFIFYLKRCGMFSKSLHYFDEEQTVQSKFRNITLQENGKNINNFFFLQSSNDKFIQVSDMLVGLLGKLFSFLDERNINEIKTIYSSLNEKQKKNFISLQNIILKSNNKCPLFLLNINSQENIKNRCIKMEILSKNSQIHF